MLQKRVEKDAMEAISRLFKVRIGFRSVTESNLDSEQESVKKPQGWLFG